MTTVSENLTNHPITYIQSVIISPERMALQFRNYRLSQFPPDVMSAQSMLRLDKPSTLANVSVLTAVLFNFEKGD